MITREEIVEAFEFCKDRGIVPAAGEYFEGDCACFVGALAFNRDMVYPHGKVREVEQALDIQGLTAGLLEAAFDNFLYDNPEATWDDVLNWYDNYVKEIGYVDCKDARPIDSPCRGDFGNGDEA